MDGTQTPEFLVWAIERRCPLRQITGFEDPERTERHLRTLRAYSEAVAEGQVFGGICVEPEVRSSRLQPADNPLKRVTTNGFRVDDALSLYGGLLAAETACRDCPANALQKENPNSLAGCFGMVPLPPDETEVHAAVEESIDRLKLRANIETNFPRTKPAWYGLWMRSPLDAPRSLLLKFILRNAGGSDPDYVRAINQMNLGLSAAYEHALPLHVRLYPRGEVRGTWWNLVPHCQSCHSPWPEAQCEHCQVCGYVGSPASPPKRRARGTRPYWPLERMLGKEKAEEFLGRYETQR
ncbi:MAG: hypothetical protein IAF94_07510 [Pirellulaceae bacterium]|nr:hypothetical protein [Pirellulaceae bacterium]